MLFFSAVMVSFAVAAVAAMSWRRRRGCWDLWLLSYVRQTPKRRVKAVRPAHVLLCIADHFEPAWHGASPETAAARVARWADEYPKLCAKFRDSDGRPPRHSFFYPLEEYDSAHVDALAEISRAGLGEVEVHLHHDGDTSAHLTQTLLDYKERLAQRHGLLSRDRTTGEVKYGFVHGNWALDNSRPDGRWCGVNDELDILRRTGCYADFTLPSAPSPTQTSKINSIYYAVDHPLRPKSHDTGTDVGIGPASRDALILIQGPLVLNWQRRKWGVLPRIENGCLQGNQPPRIDRLDLWLRARVQVPTRPDWLFVKLHTHGATELNQRVLLGEPMIQFHTALAERGARDSDFQYHYVTAREMYNLARAAEAGWSGTVDEARDFELVPIKA